MFTVYIAGGIREYLVGIAKSVGYAEGALCYLIREQLEDGKREELHPKDMDGNDAAPS